MGKYRVAKFYFDVEAQSPEAALAVAPSLTPSAQWAAPDPSARYSDSADPLLAEARWLLNEWATVRSDPGYLVERSREVVARLRGRLDELAAAQSRSSRDTERTQKPDVASVNDH